MLLGRIKENFQLIETKRIAVIDLSTLLRLDGSPDGK